MSSRFFTESGRNALRSFWQRLSNSFTGFRDLRWNYPEQGWYDRCKSSHSLGPNRQRVRRQQKSRPIWGSRRSLVSNSHSVVEISRCVRFVLPVGGMGFVLPLNGAWFILPIHSGFERITRPVSVERGIQMGSRRPYWQKFYVRDESSRWLWFFFRGWIIRCA